MIAAETHGLRLFWAPSRKTRKLPISRSSSTRLNKSQKFLPLSSALGGRLLSTVAAPPGLTRRRLNRRVVAAVYDRRKFNEEEETMSGKSKCAQNSPFALAPFLPIFQRGPAMTSAGSCSHLPFRCARSRFLDFLPGRPDAHWPVPVPWPSAVSLHHGRARQFNRLQ